MSILNKKIAIAGGGFSGVGSIVMLKEEGFDPICFEKTDKIGGTWCYREESESGVPSIMPTTVINHSKELGAISNFPPPKEYNNYMKHNELYKYFLSFVDKHDAMKHIKLNSEVVDVSRSHDYEETGKWTVSVRDTVSGSIMTDIYDAVIVCTGHINIPKMASYEDQDIFKGKILHTHWLKGVQPYVNKNVVVVGMGCSGLDAAVEISSVAKQVYLSSRSGAFVLNRVGPDGYPVDYILIRRYITKLIDIVPINILSWIMENSIINQRFNSKLYAVEPKWHVLSKDPVFNDHIGSKLLSGSVIQKGDILKFSENGVIFEGESSVTEADIVVMATGYTWKFPYLDKAVNIEEGDKINLYKCVFPPNLKHPTLAFIGFLLPFGPGFPLGEMQCRWVAQVLAGKCKLPSREEMLYEINMRHYKNSLRYNPSNKQTVRVDYTQYLDEIAKEIGCMPNFLKLFFTDPRLFLKLIFGPSVSYQYRLTGPHPWAGARDAIMKCEERVHWPLKRRKVKRVENPLITYLRKLFTFLF